MQKTIGAFFMEWVERNNKNDQELGQGILFIEAINEYMAKEHSKLPGHDSNSNSFRKHIQDLTEQDPHKSKLLAVGKLIYTTGKIKKIGKEKWEVPYKTYHRFQ